MSCSAFQNFVTSHYPEYTLEDSGKKEFFVAFVNLPRVHQLRELRTSKVGQMVSFSGTVTRTSEVRPELLFGTFFCAACGTEVRDVEQQCRYTTPTVCPVVTCGNRSGWLALAANEHLKRYAVIPNYAASVMSSRDVKR